ncbi:MAG: TonB-dependent receptor, partial [Pseudomonadota bacterium]
LSDSAAEQNEDEATSPRFAISYGPNEWFRIFGSYAEGFRAPSINELFLNGVHFSLPHPQLFNPMMGQFVFVNNNFIPNPNLKPEETQTFEVGVSGDFADLFSQGDRLKGKISYFESDIDDLINLSVDVTFDPTCFIGPTFFPCSGGTTESANLEKAEINGVEAEFRYDSERLFAQAQFSSVDGENSETGSDIGTLTPDRFSMNAAWKFPDQNLSLGSRLQYARDFERREAAMGGGFNIVEERDSYTVVDLYTTWRPNLIDGLRIDLGVDNVFDEDYERVFEGVSEPGRNYKVSLAWQFGM